MTATTTDKSTADTARETAQDTADSVKDKARDLAEEAKLKARRVAEDATETAKREAYARGEEAKHGVANEIGTVSSALRKAANDLRDGSPQERTFGYLANTLADASDSVREKDLGEMLDDVTGFARRNPLLFIGGAALLGFAATRFGKASQRSQLPAPRYPHTRQFPDPAAANATQTAAEMRLHDGEVK